LGARTSSTVANAVVAIGVANNACFGNVETTNCVFAITYLTEIRRGGAHNSGKSTSINTVTTSIDVAKVGRCASSVGV
jgi:GTP-binding protein EngB required for normal cell division